MSTGQREYQMYMAPFGPVLISEAAVQIKSQCVDDLGSQGGRTRMRPLLPLFQLPSATRLAVKLAVKTGPNWSFGGRFEYVAS
jgi:hypothetical protein